VEEGQSSGIFSFQFRKNRSFCGKNGLRCFFPDVTLGQKRVFAHFFAHKHNLFGFIHFLTHLGEGESGRLGLDAAQLLPLVGRDVLGHQRMLGLDLGEGGCVGGLKQRATMVKVRRQMPEQVEEDEAKDGQHEARGAQPALHHSHIFYHSQERRGQPQLARLRASTRNESRHQALSLLPFPCPSARPARPC